jgi:hypothetical protein
LSEVAHYTRAADQVAMARAAMIKVGTLLSNNVSPSVKQREKPLRNNGWK